MASNIMTFFKVMILVQLFYAFAITGIAETLPADALNYVEPFQEVTDEINLESVGQDVQESIGDQTSIPVIELGALVFYSGNILLNLLLNFLFAIPQMIAMLVNGFMILFLGVDSFLFAQVQLFASVAIIVIYFIGLIQLITGVRSGRVV